MAPPLSQERIVDSDESGSESSNNSVAETQRKSKGQANKKNPQPKEPASTAKAGNQSASSSDSESESDEDTVSHEKTPQNTAPRKENLIKQTTTSIPAKPFAPPEGFQSIQKNFSESTDISKPFSNLKGKQLWHITAPAGVPLTSIRELALDAVATGQSVLSHKGAEYRLREDQLGAEKTKSILLPDKHGKVYRRNRLPVVQTFHVEQMVEIPNNATAPGVEAGPTIEKLTKPPPSKPKHLRMRYKPFGSTDDRPETLGSSSEESGMEEGASHYPEGSDVDRDARKRKHTDVDGSKAQRGPVVETTAEGDLPRKKAKKEHTHSTNGTAKPDEDHASDDKAKIRGRERKSHSKSTEQKRSKKHKDETSQERRARKEDKKRKKREKENAVAG